MNESVLVERSQSFVNTFFQSDHYTEVSRFTGKPGFNQARSKRRSAARENPAAISRHFLRSPFAAHSPRASMLNLQRRPKPTESRIGSIIPLLPILSARTVSLTLDAPLRLATLLFFVANKPAAVCACLVLGAAVP
jgi:hypothetical protein